MHIAFISREYPQSARLGGIGTYVSNAGQQLLKYGHQVTVVAAADDTRTPDSVEIVDGIRLVRLGGADFAIRGLEPTGDRATGRYFRTISRYWSYRRKIAGILEKLIEKAGIDIVEFAEYGAEAAVWMRLPRRIPMVVRLHTPSTLDRSSGARIRESPLTWLQYRLALAEYEPLRCADAISSCSTALADWVKIDAGLQEREVRIIPNPVETSDWMCEQLDDRQTSASTAIEITYAGTVVPTKGIPDLLEAVALLRRESWDISLNLAGRLGRYGLELAERCRMQPDVAKWLRLVGQQPRAQLKELYRRSTLVCLPSWWDAFPLVCLEAMAAGAIVIGSRAGGMREMIDHGVNGFLVEPHDAAGLARCISEVLDMRPDQLDEIRFKAKELVRARFDTDVVVPQMINFYRNVLSDFSGRNVL